MVTNIRTTGQIRANDLGARESHEAKRGGGGPEPDSEHGLVLSERDRIWIEQNQAFFAFWNGYVEKHGIPLEQFRNF